MTNTERTTILTRNLRWMLLTSLYIKHPIRGILVVLRYADGETDLPRTLIATDVNGKEHRVRTNKCLTKLTYSDKLTFNSRVTGSWACWSTTTTYTREYNLE